MSEDINWEENFWDNPEDVEEIDEENVVIDQERDSFLDDEEDDWFLNSLMEDDEEDEEISSIKNDAYKSTWLPSKPSPRSTSPEMGSFSGIFKNEGARTGQPTNLNSSAVGRGQMIKGTRMAMYKKLGVTDVEQAEKQFRTDPDFEMQVMNAYRGELDARIPKDVQGKQREYMIAKGWYTGDPFYDDNKVPGREAGNRMTAGEYARKAVMQSGGLVNNIPPIEYLDQQDFIGPEGYGDDQDFEDVDDEPKFNGKKAANTANAITGAVEQGMSLIDKVKAFRDNIGNNISKTASDTIDYANEIQGFNQNQRSLRKFNEQKNEKKFQLNRTITNSPLIYV